jgi:hypothetical protein
MALSKITNLSITDDTIENADIKSSAAIALSKLATDPSNASNLASGTVPTARLGSGTASSSTFLRGDNSWQTPSGFDVSSITGQTALTSQPDATDEIVLSDAGTLKRLDIKHIQNTPAFAATVSSATSVGDNSYTKIELDTEVLDSDGTYDNSTNYRFTPAVAGKYFIYGMVAIGAGSGVSNAQQMFVAIYKNGSLYQQAVHDGRNNAYGDTFGGSPHAIVDLDADDYVELFVKFNDGGGSSSNNYYTESTTFGGFRIAGV